MPLSEAQSAVVRSCLEQILASPVFSKAKRQRAFLRFVVENTISGQLDALKEYQIGLSVYERGSSYDTRSDPIVRVEASRLRSKILEYYDSYGRQDEVRIELPKGTYVATFHWSGQPVAKQEASSAAPPRGGFLRAIRLPVSLRWIGLLAACIALAGLVFLYRSRFAPAVPDSRMPRSIAILPFRDFSKQSGISELGDSIAEALSEELSRVEGLSVAGRTSTRRLRDRKADLKVLGSQLNVGAVLEGSIQSEGTELRVRARLIDVASGYQLWSGTFDRSGAQVFAVQDEIARAIASTLRLELDRKSEPQEARTSPSRLAAHDLFLKGRELHRRGDSKLLVEARRIHLEAVKTDPSYPLAHSGLAHIDITIIADGLRPASELRGEVVSSIERALALDPGLSDAFSARVRLARDIDTDWRTVENTCRDVTRLFPNAASIRANCGTAYSLLGKFDQAESELRAAIRLDPLWFGGMDGLASMLYLAGRRDEALRQVEELMRVDPLFLGAHRTYARVLAGSGRLQQAKQFLEQKLISAPDSRELWSLLGFVRGRQNDKKGALECLAKLGPRPLEVEQALIWAGIGDVDRAAAHLERALEQQETAALEILVDPAIPLGSHTRRLRDKVKL